MKQLTVVLVCLLAGSVGAAEPSALRLSRSVPLPGVKGRFDHLAIDVKGRRLFLAALGNDTLEVIDIAAGKLVRSVTGLKKPTGVLYLPELNRIAVANGEDGTFRVFDAGSYALVKTLRSLDDADNVRLDLEAGTVYVGYGSGALGVLDDAGFTIQGSIPLPGHPESFQLEPRGSRVFVNVPSAAQVTVIDRQKRAVVATWPTGDLKANFPMALDEAHGRLLIGCRQPPRLAVLDTATGVRVCDLAISRDADDLFYDSVSGRIYVSCGEGYIDVIEQKPDGGYQLKERIGTAPGARTSFFSPDLNMFFLAVPMHGDQMAEVRFYAASRP